MRRRSLAMAPRIRTISGRAAGAGPSVELPPMISATTDASAESPTGRFKRGFLSMSAQATLFHDVVNTSETNGVWRWRPARTERGRAVLRGRTDAII